MLIALFICWLMANWLCLLFSNCLSNLYYELKEISIGQILYSIIFPLELIIIVGLKLFRMIYYKIKSPTVCNILNKQPFKDNK